MSRSSFRTYPVENSATGRRDSVHLRMVGNEIANAVLAIVEDDQFLIRIVLREKIPDRLRHKAPTIGGRHDTGNFHVRLSLISALPWSAEVLPNAIRLVTSAAIARFSTIAAVILARYNAPKWAPLHVPTGASRLLLQFALRFPLIDDARLVIDCCRRLWLATLFSIEEVGIVIRVRMVL
jgi:hypothetical protein